MTSQEELGDENIRWALLYFPSSSTSRLVLTSETPAAPGALQSAQKHSVLHLKWLFSFTSKANFSLTPTFTELCGEYQHVEAQQSLSTGARTQITGVKTCFAHSVCWKDVWMTLKNASWATKILFLQEKSLSLWLQKDDTKCMLLM